MSNIAEINARTWRAWASKQRPEVRAVHSLHRAIDTLLWKGDQWERGDAALALADAIMLLRSRIALLAKAKGESS